MLTTTVAFGQEQDIRAAERAWSKAIVAGDTAALTKLLGPELIYGHSTGIVDTKDQYIAKIASGKQKYEGVEHDGVIVKMYGDTAIMHSRIHMWGVNQSGKFDDRLMLLHTWLKTAAGWQLIAHQTAKL